RQFLSVERRSESGADHHGQRAARRRSPARAPRRPAICGGRRDGMTRARSMLVLAALLAAWAAAVIRAAPAADRASTTRGLGVTAVDTIGMTVEDMDRAVAFYTSVLTFEKVSDVEVAG